MVNTINKYFPKDRAILHDLQKIDMSKCLQDTRKNPPSRAKPVAPRCSEHSFSRKCYEILKSTHV